MTTEERELLKATAIGVGVCVALTAQGMHPKIKKMATEAATSINKRLDELN